MFRCGIDYSRCRWIMPLLLLFAIIFDIIAIAAQSGWVEDESGKAHYTSMWTEYRHINDKWEEKSLMDEGWAQAVAALMIIGLIILIFAFIISIVGMLNVESAFFIITGVLLVIVAILQIIALIIYPVNFNEKIFEGRYYYTWAYGFGWGATIICLGCSFIFCCLTNCLDDIRGDEKIRYIYESK
ncbi:p53 apoptosis effector related to PMP-22 [Fundulus heteroclitus]|uniref:p53 apoptosis effector related to PMP-22 n=1 Tax=Fundulus heteroclitus TaxID=8078 RepID=UPI00165C4E80|nr:p53 apoptosis effector related to PMP-22 [Fundulus heteroclitus]